MVKLSSATFLGGSASRVGFAFPGAALGAVVLVADSIAFYLSAELAAETVRSLRLIGTNGSFLASTGSARHREARAVVVDPASMQPTCFKRLFSAASLHRLPFVVFSNLTVDSIYAVARALSLGPALWVSGNPSYLYTLLDRHVFGRWVSLGTSVLGKIAPVLHSAPPLLAVNIVALFSEDVIASVSDFALRSAVSRRGLYRWHNKLGICPPHDLVAISKIVHTYNALRYESCSVARALDRASYASAKTFYRNLEVFTSLTPRALRGTDELALAARLAAATRRVSLAS